MNERLIAIYNHEYNRIVEEDVVFDEDMIKDKRYGCMCLEFFKNNLDFLILVFRMSDLPVDYAIDKSIITSFYKIDFAFQIFSLPENIKLKDETEKLIDNNILKPLENTIRLLYIQNFLLGDLNVIENKLGEELVINIDDVNILITDVVKTNYKFLTEDCKTMNLTDAFEYVCKFNTLYKFNLNPFLFYKNKVIFDFHNILDDKLVITSLDRFRYKIVAENVPIADLPEIFSKNDEKVLKMIYKIFLANRFVLLRKYFNSFVKENNFIDIGNGKSISLTAEGLKFTGTDKIQDDKMTRMLNTDRVIFKHLNTDK